MSSSSFDMSNHSKKIAWRAWTWSTCSPFCTAQRKIRQTHHAHQQPHHGMQGGETPSASTHLSSKTRQEKWDSLLEATVDEGEYLKNLLVLLIYNTQFLRSWREGCVEKVVHLKSFSILPSGKGIICFCCSACIDPRNDPSSPFSMN